MADTTLLKNEVEPEIRQALATEFGQPFRKQSLRLIPGGSHEFNAVSEDGKIVASIKSHSGMTSGGNLPSGKFTSAFAELYFLTLVPGEIRVLVVTDPEFHQLLKRELDGKLAPGIGLKLVTLPEDLRRRVETVRRRASDEMRSPLEPGQGSRTQTSATTQH